VAGSIFNWAILILVALNSRFQSSPASNVSHFQTISQPAVSWMNYVHL